MRSNPFPGSRRRPRTEAEQARATAIWRQRDAEELALARALVAAMEANPHNEGTPALALARAKVARLEGNQP